MTVYGLRDDVKLIRENANGKQEIIPLDLNKAETILSPYYYLQQNDIIYVTPIRQKREIRISELVQVCGSLLLRSLFLLPVYCLTS